MALLNHIPPAPPRWSSLGFRRALWSFALLIFFGGALLAARPSFAGGTTPALTEAQIKAAFLLNFPRYAEWPSAAFPAATSPFVVIVVADKQVEKELRRMAEGKVFNGRSLEVRLVAASDEIASDCQILFIGLAEERNAARIIAGLGGRSVLTVGECEDFFEDGGMIMLVRREQKIRLAINLVPTEAAGLKISSKLLSVADVVKRREDAPR